MKQIPLYGRNGVGKFALVDDEDYEFLMQWRWFGVYSEVSCNMYVICNYKTDKGKYINKKMHHLFFNKTKGQVVDHIDGDGLNNQRSNLRLCTFAENMLNKRKYKNGSSKYPGVTHRKASKKSRTINDKWCARIQINKKLISLGLFPFTPEGELQAYEAYKVAAEKYFGEFRRISHERKTHIDTPKNKRDVVHIPELPQGVKGIQLTKGKYAIVDESDYEMLSKFTWCAGNSEGDYYKALTHYSRKTHPDRKRAISMHRMIMNPPEGYTVDHINNDPLDNRRCNLRLSLPWQNSANTRMRKTKRTSQYKGVFKKTDKRYNTSYWITSILIKGKKIHLGCFPYTPEDERKAAIAYNEAAIKYKGEFANINVILPLEPNLLFCDKE